MTGEAGAPDLDGTPLVEIRDLRVALRVEGGRREVLAGVDLAVSAGEALGVVGESGSGKSMTLRAVARTLPRGAAVRGRVTVAGRDVMALRGASLRAYRSRDVAMVFQDPRAHVNPVRTVGDFLTEGLVLVKGVSRRQAEARALALLTDVGVDRGPRRLRQYPHELSGGLLQRVVIAAALAQDPRVLLADEPTTALDVTTQSDVMAVLDELRRDRGMGMVFVTHDLDLAAAVCDRTAVMYAGRVVEMQPSDRLHAHPLHPYSALLAGARPDPERRVPRLATVPGAPVAAGAVRQGCAFADRCPHVQDECRAESPGLRDVAGGLVRCRRAEDLALSPGALIP